MLTIGRNIKVWIFVTLCSLLLWVIYWIPSSLSRVYDFVFLSGGGFGGWMYTWMELSGAIGTIVRSVGVIFGLYVLFLIRSCGKRVFDVKKWIVSALIIEAFYYAMVGFPSGTFMLSSGYGGAYRTLGAAYALQFLFTTPLLIVLAITLHRAKQDSQGFKSWRWAGAVFAGYIGALWTNSVFRWFDMVADEGLAFFSVGIRTVGALNAFVLMSLALVFALIGAYSLVRNKDSAVRWFGASLALVGLHYLIYLIYSYLGGMITFVMIVEVWSIPLLGLGLSLLKMRKQKPMRNEKNV